MKRPHLLLRLLLVSTLFLVLVIQSRAQSGGSAISGFVFEENGTIVESASIKVTNTSNGFSTQTITDKKGYFILSDLPVGTYNIEVSAVGFTPTVINNNVLNLSDRLVLHKIVLTKTSNVLNQITVVSNSFKNSIDRLGTATAVSARALQKIPIPSRNYTDLMFLSPLANGSSLAGAKSGGTGYMLDGVSNRRATFGGVTDAMFSISSEVIKEFEISTNDYDVADGRGSGGLVKAITKSGTNTFQGSAWSYYGSNSLAAKKNIDGNSLNSKYQIFQVGALLSGPIIKDKLHFLVAYDQYKNTIPFRAYDFTNSGATVQQGEKNLGITQANLDKIVSVMENKFGFPKGPEYGTINIDQITRNAFGKLDWNINKKNLLTLKYNYLYFSDPNKLKSNGLLSTQYTGVEIDNSVLLGLRSEFSSTAYNDLKLNFSTYRKFLHYKYNRVPEGFVNVNSMFSDGTIGNKTVAFGNQNWVPERDASDVIQIVDNFHYKTGNLNFTFGTDNNINHITDRLSHDQQGQFYYNSIDSMSNNLPYRFNRKIPLNGENPMVGVTLFELSLYGQMQTNIRPNINLTVGLRWDGTIVGGRPVYNPQLDNDLHVRTDVVPFDAKNFQPRVNLIWDLHNDGRDIFKFGAGLFASELTTQPLTFAHIDNGVTYRQVDVTQPSLLPTADWQAYQKDFSKVPGVDYYNSLPDSIKKTATALVIDKNLKNPLTLKTNVSFYHYINDWLRVGANAYFNNTWDNFYLYDINLKRNPEFVTNEGRDIYVKASNIANNKLDPSVAGGLPIKYSRISSNFNQVRYFTNASWSSKYIGFMVEASAKIGRDGSASVSYAKGKATGTPPYDSGDPRNANFSVGSSYWDYASYGKNWYSDGDQPNKIVALFLSPTFYGFSISSSFQFFQNSRYTVNINRDIIGEGNDGTDLAYIYDPNNANTPANIRDGMNSLLQKTSPQFRKYLQQNFGKFAAYNGGLQPWRSLWNLSVIKEFKVYKTHRLALRADIFNVLNLLNHQWGGYHQVVNTTLYNVTGFDATTNQFKYSVNQNAGALQTSAVSYYSVQFGVHYAF